MLAIAAAILFGLALLLDLANVSLGNVITLQMFVVAGLLCLALHFAGVGTTAGPNYRWRRR